MFVALYPTTFVKRKVTLALQEFNEKTITAFNMQDYFETIRFVTQVLRTWECPNIKSPEACWMLFDDDRKPFTNAYDQRLGYLTSSATMFKSMYTESASSKTRILGLTTDASNALHITLNGVVKLITLLSTKIKYVLTVEFQSDKI